MAIEGAICVVECIQQFRDGNCVIKDARKGERFEIPQHKWAQLRNSAPNSWELIETKIPKARIPRAKKTAEKKDATSEK